MRYRRIFQWIWGVGIAYTKFEDGSELLILPFVIVAWFPENKEENA
jgi:hypothetical protein